MCGNLKNAYSAGIQTRDVWMFINNSSCNASDTLNSLIDSVTSCNGKTAYWSGNFIWLAVDAPK